MAIGERQTGLTAGCFRCADDKWVYLLGNEQWRHWDKTMAALGVSKFHFGDPAGKEAPKPDYRQSTAEVDAIIREKTYDEWHGIFEAHDVWHAPVNKFEDMYGDEQANAVGTFVDVPGLDHKLIALPVKFSSQEGLAGPVMGAPKLGEHTDEVLGELGIGLKDIQQLRKEGVTK
jgi:crotonobetainyl-CoA:carnitine CoA-transferase CaiB-like acyl-CoA transferase